MTKLEVVGQKKLQKKDGDEFDEPIDVYNFIRNDEIVYEYVTFVEEIDNDDDIAELMFDSINEEDKVVEGALMEGMKIWQPSRYLIVIESFERKPGLVYGECVRY